MFPNLITGQGQAFKKYPPNENESTYLDSSTTLTVVILCIVGPFWLLYRLLEFIAKKSIWATTQALQKIASSQKSIN